MVVYGELHFLAILFVLGNCICSVYCKHSFTHFNNNVCVITVITRYYDLTHFILESSSVYKWLEFTYESESIKVYLGFHPRLVWKLNWVLIRFIALKTTQNEFSTTQIHKKFRYAMPETNFMSNTELRRCLCNWEAPLHTSCTRLCPSLLRGVCSVLVCTRSNLGWAEAISAGLSLPVTKCLIRFIHRRVRVLSISRQHAHLVTSVFLTLVAVPGTCKVCSKSLLSEAKWINWNLHFPWHVLSYII